MLKNSREFFSTLLVGFLLQLQKHATEHGRVHERDHRAFRPPARALVEQGNIRLGKLGERRLDVLDQDADVVHTLSALVDESGQGAGVIGRRDQLDTGVAR